MALLHQIAATFYHSLQHGFYWLWLLVLRGPSRIGGVTLSCTILGCALLDFARRQKDYPYFRELRQALPASLRPEPTSRRHFWIMIRNWHSVVAYFTHYDRLGSPAWKARVTVRGTPPHQLPGVTARPVIVVFLHTGPFGIIRFWLRSQGLPTAGFLAGAPPITKEPMTFIWETGDHRFGLRDIPQHFRGAKSLLSATRFLKGNRLVVMALDGNPASDQTEIHTFAGRPIHLHSGPLRLAALTHAIVQPATAHATSPGRFEIHFGRPLPESLLDPESPRAAIEYLLQEMIPDIQPDEPNWAFLESLSPDKIRRRFYWP